MRIFFFSCLLFIFSNAISGEVGDYLQLYRQNATSDYSKETKILSAYSLKGLTDELLPFYSDTTVMVRHKAYYLTYKKGIQSTGDRTPAVQHLLKGIHDSDGGIIGQILRHLQEFTSTDFNPEAQSVITARLQNNRMPHYKELVLLAGYTNMGRETLYQQYLVQNLSTEIKWCISLALARMGDENQLEYCINKAKSLPVNDYLINSVLPNLVYTRQKPAINYCVEIMKYDEKLCHSLNPDISEKINCGYRIIELLAPVVVGMPITIDPAGDIVTIDYQKTLQLVRQWFLENEYYQITKISF